MEQETTTFSSEEGLIITEKFNKFLEDNSAVVITSAFIRDNGTIGVKSELFKKIIETPEENEAKEPGEVIEAEVISTDSPTVDPIIAQPSHE